MTRLFVLLSLAVVTPAHSLAQAVSDADLQRRANAVLTLMGFALTPDVTTGSLSIGDQAAGNPYFRQTSISGGGTLRRRPLYLEGTLAYGRYDPTFATSDGGITQRIPVKWDSLLGTAGLGWDFPIARELVIRPIANLSLGRVESSVTASPSPPTAATSATRDFLERGQLNAAGIGGSLMLDYEHYRPDGEVDAELRYSSIHLQSFQSSSAVQGHALAQTLSFWSRYRAPTRMSALDRPVRYVLEYAHTRFLGDLEGALGFEYVNSFGAGLELDTSAREVYATRLRLLLRYKAGNHVTGWAVGVAASF